MSPHLLLQLEQLLQLLAPFGALRLEGAHALPLLLRLHLPPRRRLLRLPQRRRRAARRLLFALELGSRCALSLARGRQLFPQARRRRGLLLWLRSLGSSSSEPASTALYLTTPSSTTSAKRFERTPSARPR